jgi:cell division septation protein DedD
MLFPETANSRPVELTKPVTGTAPVVPTSKTTPPTAPANPVASTGSVTPAPSSSGTVLQTGLFSKEANARAQSDALQKAGFTASVSRKLVNGADYWVVTVPAGQNVNATIQALKKAGFDSFPVK